MFHREKDVLHTNTTQPWGRSAWIPSQILILAILLAFAPVTALADNSASVPQLQSEHLRIEFDGNLYSRVIARFDNKETPLGAFVPSETVRTSDQTWNEIALTSQKAEHAQDAIGPYERLSVSGKNGALLKTVSVTIYNAFPDMAFFDVQYTNQGTAKLSILSWTNNAYSVNARHRDAAAAFWSYQSGSYQKRPDWVFPLHTGFHRDNFQGMNASDYGGGTPIVDVWRQDIGIGVGHVELRPKLVSLPVSMPDAAHATLGVRFEKVSTLGAGDSLHTFRTFVAVHQRDYFQTLTNYRAFMAKQGLQAPPPPERGQGAIWCAWGYGRSMQPKQVYDTLPGTHVKPDVVSSDWHKETSQQDLFFS